jgi:Domain of Unknown Function (DUF1521)
MTTIAANPSNNFAANFNQNMDAAGFVMAAGILGSFMNPLGAGALAFGMLPAFLNIRCGTMPTGCFPTNPVIPEPKANWTVQTTGQSTANIDLGDGYKLQIDERSSEMTILNTATGQSTRIWGDPHVDVNGQRKFDFWGTTTFTLANGTKITINTEQWKGNPNAYVASQVVITKGQNAIVVDGISQNKIGDLSISMSNNGYAVDAAHRDGFTIHEGGGSWQTECGRTVTQAEANVTAVGGQYGPGSGAMSLGEAGEMLGAFLFLGLLSRFAPIDSILPHRDHHHHGHHKHHHHFGHNHGHHHHLLGLHHGHVNHR